MHTLSLHDALPISDPGQEIDHRVGLGEVASLGAKVGSDRPLAIVHASSEEAAQRAARELSAAFTVTDRTAETFPVIHERVATG